MPRTEKSAVHSKVYEAVIAVIRAAKKSDLNEALATYPKDEKAREMSLHFIQLVRGLVINELKERSIAESDRHQLHGKDYRKHMVDLNQDPEFRRSL